MPHSALEFPLLPGESASGFLLRVAPIVRPSIRAEIDYFLGLDDALASAVFRSELAVWIAETLGTSRYDMLAAMIHKSAGYYTLGDFHLRTGQITQWRRRVSPSVLNLDARYGCFPPHHRLVWSIDGLNDDPEYRCRIVDACPRCREYLRWSTATDVETCTVCGCDLATTPVDEGEPTTFDNFLMALFHPNEDVRMSVRRSCPEAVRWLPEGDVLDLLLGLAKIAAVARCGVARQAGIEDRDNAAFVLSSRSASCNAVVELLTSAIRKEVSGLNSFLGSALRLSEVKALVRVPRSPQATQFLQEILDTIS
jgi:hypothetical protein